MTTNDDDESLGRETLNFLGWHPTLEESQQGLLLMAKDDGSPGAYRYAAFEALVDIFSETVKSNNERPQPQECVEVPWWVIEFLVSGWQNYREEPKSTFGKALGLEGTGGRRVLTKLDQRHRDLMLTMEIVHLVETEGLSVEKAVGDVFERHSDPTNDENKLLSPERIQKIYNRYKEKVKVSYSRKGRPS